MHSSGPTDSEEWYDLMVDNRLLASIKGKQSAEWFLTAMSRGPNTGERYRLISRSAEEKSTDYSEIKATKPW